MGLTIFHFFFILFSFLLLPLSLSRRSHGRLLSLRFAPPPPPLPR
jgi:hypothetical protein